MRYICHTVECVLHMVVSHNLTKISNIISFTVNLTQVNVSTCAIPALLLFPNHCQVYWRWYIWTYIYEIYLFSFNELTVFSSFYLISSKSLSYLVAGLFMHTHPTSLKIMAKKNSTFYYNYYFRVGKSFSWPP